MKSNEINFLNSSLDNRDRGIFLPTGESPLRPGNLRPSLGGLVRASFVLFSLGKKDLDAVPVGGFCDETPRMKQPRQP